MRDIKIIHMILANLGFGKNLSSGSYFSSSTFSYSSKHCGYADRMAAHISVIFVN